ncbi:CHAP domain-containing protein [Kitasatospora sp. NPDC056184]|uniref:CHAP domain-containing protein n=1 Tax=Kitasatospora sp. NPDC056184 TaxID=3345738 RepID=UPI0035D74B0B
MKLSRRTSTAAALAVLTLLPALGAAATSPAASAATVRDRVVSVARGEITPDGVSPEKSGSCDKYFAYHKNGGSCAKTPWCAAFAEWTWHRAGIEETPDVLAARGIGKWGRQKGLFHQRGAYTPKPGDLVVYGEPDGGTPGHVGVIVAVHRDGTLDTVDGNLGDEVALRTRLDPSEVRTNHQPVSGYVSPPGA